MLTKYEPVIRSFGSGICRALQVQLQLDDTLPLWEGLVRRGFGQADVVLVLLHLTLIPEVEALIGHPITRFPPRPPRAYPALPRRAYGPDDRRIVAVVRDNPRLPSTPSHERFSYFVPERSLATALKYGVTRRDIREALRNNWIWLENV